jgi:phosphoglycerate kinase
MKTLKDFDFKNKRVLVRCDFNVPLDEKGKILDDFRIRQTIPTIEYLAKRGAKIILMSHLDEPEGRVIESLRLTPIEEKLKEYFGHLITKANDCIGKKIENQISKMRAGEILLLENLRFYKEEKKNEKNFAKKLAKLADLYINDAFGACHRAHASIVGVPRYLPSGAGLLLEKEIKVLSQVLKKPWRPLVTIIGGVKISSKIKVIEKFLEKADHLLLGGEIANAILASKGILVSQPMPEPEIIKIIEKIDLTWSKLHLPVDVLISLADLDTGLKEGYLRQGGPGQVKKEEKCYDIGPETIKIFSRIIKEAKMIFWSGPLGMFEKEEFSQGTKNIAQIIARNHQAFKIAGGGDTISALNKFNLLDKFDHVSTGGGAMLEFLSQKELPGLKALSHE